MQADLLVLELSSDRLRPCVVTTSQAPDSFELPDSCQVTVSLEDAEVVSGRGYDFEEALQVLRGELESRGLHLLCNRFRRDAFVSSLGRQMSAGLGCYLVKPRRPLDSREVVDSLGPADRSDVVSAAQAAAFIERWRSRRPPLPLLLFRVIRMSVRDRWEEYRDR